MVDRYHIKARLPGTQSQVNVVRQGTRTVEITNKNGVDLPKTQEYPLVRSKMQ